MQNRDEISKRFGGQLLSDLINGGNPNSNRATWLILALLAFVGEEAVQVLYRKNFGVGGLNIFRIILCFLLFEVIAVVFFLSGANMSPSMDVIGSKASYTWAGVFYIILGFIVLFKGLAGVAKARNSKQPYKFTGESAILAFLGKDGWSQSKIQNVAEPILTLSVGFAFALVNILWGIPIIYCALSVWACKIIDAVFFDPSDPFDTQSTSRQQQGRDFHNVK